MGSTNTYTNITAANRIYLEKVYRNPEKDSPLDALDMQQTIQSLVTNDDRLAINAYTNNSKLAILESTDPRLTNNIWKQVDLNSGIYDSTYGTWEHQFAGDGYGNLAVIKQKTGQNIDQSRYLVDLPHNDLNGAYLREINLQVRFPNYPAYSSLPANMPQFDIVVYDTVSHQQFRHTSPAYDTSTTLAELAAIHDINFDLTEIDFPFVATNKWTMRISPGWPVPAGFMLLACTMKVSTI